VGARPADFEATESLAAGAGARPRSVPVVCIVPPRGLAALGLAELWAHRELLYFLTWRDVKVRYKQTIAGAGWAVAQPLLTAAVFSLFFGRLVRVPSDGLPYPAFVMAALVPWTLFANSLTQASASVVGSAQLIRKVYFPRLVLPISAALGAAIDFALALAVLVGLVALYGIAPSPRLLAVPLLALLAFVAALGVGLWLSALHVRFRDVRYVVPFLVQIWMFCTPVAYPASLVPAEWRALYALNPMVGVVEGFRWAVLGSPVPIGGLLIQSAAIALLVLALGLLVFRRIEITFADVV
jgi:lipopolysaccharide transport system permease protein